MEREKIPPSTRRFWVYLLTGLSDLEVLLA